MLSQDRTLETLPKGRKRYLSLVFVGTRGEVEKSDTHRYNASLLVLHKVFGWTRILIDIGEDNKKIWRRYNPQYILLTHAHSDHCFPSWRTPVLTSEGPKPISFIREGDKVWTHKNRLRRVTRVISYGINKLTPEERKGHSERPYHPPDTLMDITLEQKRKLRITSNHPVKTSEGWKTAGDLKEGDLLLARKIKECPVCGGPIFNPEYNFCSSSCRAKFNYPKLKERLSKAVILSNQRRMKGELLQRARERMKKVYRKGLEASRKTVKRKQSWKKGLRIARKTIRNYGQSGLERKTKWYLEKKGIKYIPQFKLEKGQDKRGQKRYYFIDLYLPNYNLLVECNGNYWHSRPRKIERDEKLKNLAVERGFRIIFLTEEEINNYDFSRLNLSQVDGGQLEFDYIKVKEVNSRPNKLGNRFNLEVEEDNSYIANGIVVHNCGGLKEGVGDIPVFMNATTSNLIKDYPIKNRQVFKGSFRIKKVRGIRIIPVEVVHSVVAPTIGYRIEIENYNIGYFPDVLWIKNKDKVLKGLDIYIGDGSFITRDFVRKKEKKGIYGHSSIKSQLSWLRKNNVRKAIFTHIGNEGIKLGDRELEKKIKELAGEDIEASIAKDGMEVVLASLQEKQLKSPEVIVPKKIVDTRPEWGLYLVSPHPQLIWRGKKSAIVRTVKFTKHINEPLELYCRTRLWGIIKIGEPTKISKEEFDNLRDRHQITKEEYERWGWKGKDLYFYPVHIINRYHVPRYVKLPRGIQNFVETSKVKEVKDKYLLKKHIELHKEKRIDELDLASHSGLVLQMKERGLIHLGEDWLDGLEYLIKDITTYDPKKVGDSPLKDDFRICCAWYCSKKKGVKVKYSYEEIERLASKIVKELIRRKLVEFHPEKMKECSRELYSKVIKELAKVEVPEDITQIDSEYVKDLTDEQLLELYEWLHKVYRQWKFTTGGKK